MMPRAGEFVLFTLIDLDLRTFMLLFGDGHRLHKRILSLRIIQKKPVAYQMLLLSHFTKERGRVLQLLQLDLEHRICVDEVIASLSHVVEHLD